MLLARLNEERYCRGTGIWSVEWRKIPDQAYLAGLARPSRSVGRGRWVIQASDRAHVQIPPQLKMYE